MRSYVLAIDQGTSSSRAIVFDDKLHVVAVAQEEFTQHFPRPGFVEHDAEEIWDKSVACARAMVGRADVYVAFYEAALRGLNGHLHRIEVLTFDQLVRIADRVLSIFEDKLNGPERLSP